MSAIPAFVWPSRAALVPSRLAFCSLSAMLLLLSGACGGAPIAAPESTTPVSTAEAAAANSGQPTKQQLATEFGPVTEEKFGQKVYDPFRGLEKGEDPAVVEWTRLQNKRTRDVIDGAGNRDALKKKLGAILEIGSVQVPAIRMKAGKSVYFYTKREGKQSQPVLYVRDADWRGKAAPRALVDVSTMGGTGDKKVPVSLDWWVPSDDGSLLAWGASENGSEESTLHLRNVATGADLKDEIPYTRHASIAWEPGNKAFYYTRYPVPGSVPEGDEKYFRKIYRHELGADWKKDALVFGEGRAKTDSPSVDLSPDGRYLVVGVHQGWSKSEIYLKDLKTKGAEFAEVTSGKENYYEPFFAYGKLWLRTNDEASTFRVVEVPYAKPKEWVTRVKHDIDTLTNVSPTKSGFALEYLHNASSRLVFVPKNVLTGTPFPMSRSGDVALPGVGTISTEGHELSDELFYSFVSYARPATVFAQSASHALAQHGRSGSSEPPKEPEVFESVGKSASLGDIRVEQTTATSKDGMEIPLFLVGKESVLKGPRKNIPVVLYGYGGFNISQTPQFSPRALIVAQSCGIWAHAILRGGGAFGESWHEAGKRHKKQNVFN
ncbi:MAG: hypothetical protein KBF88_08680, partial [Polyangiaceae bacterium]|nr:hypothetical protein [Polyangiaceae bacterium]